MTYNTLKIVNFYTCVLVSSLFSSVSTAEIIVPYTPANQLEAEVSVSVTQNPNSQAYKYSYSIASSPDSKQSAWVFRVDFDQNAQLFNMTSPKGWEANLNTIRPTISWTSVVAEPLAEGEIDDGNLPLSPYDIKPGETLTGFSFESLSPPAEYGYTLVGFVKIPTTTGDFEDFYAAGTEIPKFGEDGFKGITSAPNAPSYYYGGRRPAVDGFLTYLNVEKGMTFKTKAVVIIKFSAVNEVVYPDTFTARLNREDITHLFRSDDKFGGDMYAVLDLTNSPLIDGKNVLLTTVDGLVPNTSRRASDADRVTFSFVP